MTLIIKLNLILQGEIDEKITYSCYIRIVCISSAFADWRMDKFDLNNDGFVVKEELKEAGCVLQVGLFNA